MLFFVHLLLLYLFLSSPLLQLINVDLTRLKGLDQLKETLTKLCVHNTLQTLKVNFFFFAIDFFRTMFSCRLS